MGVKGSHKEAREGRHHSLQLLGVPLLDKFHAGKIKAVNGNGRVNALDYYLIAGAC